MSNAGKTETYRAECGDNEPENIRLRLLCTTDLHMHLRGYSYYADESDPTTGLARTATLIRAARQEAEADGRRVLWLDNGESLQGRPFGDGYMGEGTGGHPMMAALA